MLLDVGQNDASSKSFLFLYIFKHLVESWVISSKPWRPNRGTSFSLHVSVYKDRQPPTELQNPTKLQTWFGGRFWPKNEEGSVGSAPIPLRRKSRNQFMNR